MPKEIIADRPVIRVSLGARLYRQARRLADLMAAEARLIFGNVERNLMAGADENENGKPVEQLFSGDTYAETLAETRGYLKAFKAIAEQAAPEPTASQLQITGGIRDLVLLSRELEAQKSRPPFSELITGNADHLKRQALRKLLLPATPLPEASNTCARSRHLDDEEFEEDQYDERGNRIPDFLLDRRHVKRRKSRKPLFSRIATDYLIMCANKKGPDNKDVRIARSRLEVFIEIIGV